MTRPPLALTLALASALACQVLTRAPARGEQVTLTPSKDNTIFEEGGDLSNGKGTGLFAGQTARTQSLRRGLLAFDVAGGIPAGATITSVELRLRVTMTLGGTRQMSLHRVQADWGEGMSNSNVRGGGMGAPAAPGDATWSHRFFDTAQWASPGGDFNPAASATANAAGSNTTTSFASTAALVADVQSWLDNPPSNFGWLLRGAEATTGSAKRFASREVTQAANRPQLIVMFEMSAQTPTATPTATIEPSTPTPTITLTPSATRTVTPTRPTSTPTVTITPGGPCVGDCNGDGVVMINELITGVNIVLGITPVSACPAFDPDGGGTVTIADLVTAVNNALNGCPP